MGFDGAPPERLDFGLARTISYGPDGGLVIDRNTDDPAHWKRYRGGRTGQFWVKEIANEAFRPLI